jgi:hypothetical protein
VIAHLNLAGTLELAGDAARGGTCSSSPAPTRVARICDSGTEQFRPFAERFAITYLTGLPTQQLGLSTLPNSIIYYLLVYRDGAGEISIRSTVERLGKWRTRQSIPGWIRRWIAGPSAAASRARWPKWMPSRIRPCAC